MLVGQWPPCLIVFKLDDEDEDEDGSVDIVIVGDEQVIFLEESSKSFAYRGAYHQPWKRTIL